MTNYPMVDQIDRLIGNIIAKGGEIYLPGVGSLYTERQSARKISRRMVQPPMRQIQFSTQAKGASLIEYLVQTANCNESDASIIYERWLSQVYQNEVLTLKGIGCLQFKHFKTDPEFEKRLNPQGTEPVMIKTGYTFDLISIIGIVAVVLGLCFGGYIYYSQQSTKDNKTKASTIETLNAEHSPAVDSDASTVENIPESQQTFGEGGITQNEETATTQEQPTSAQEAKRSVQGSADEPAQRLSKRSYVVLGVFSSKRNINNTLNIVAKNHPDWQCGVYRFGENIMVSGFESDSVEECREFINQNKSDFPDMWVHTSR